MITQQFRRVQAARTALLLDQPFFGVLALQLRLTEDSTCETAWTDGKTLGFNPSFVDTLSQDELTFVIAHEVMHCAAGHPWRRGTRDQKKWNIAADYAINGILKDAGFTLLDDVLLDSRFAGKASEWIYDRLPEPKDDPNGKPDPSGNGPQTGEVRDAPGDADAPTEADWQQSTKQAEKIAQAQGKLPTSMRRNIDKLTSERVDWRSLLRKYVQEVVKADYSWTRPNVRYLCSNMFLPTLHSIACGRIVVAVDTSGSIDGVLISQFASEIQAIASEVQPSSLDVMYCDAKVHRVDTFDRGDMIKIDAVGGGGTSFIPVFEHVEQSGDTPVVLIYLTDLYGSFPSDAPDYPVIWCVAGNCTSAPFGDVVFCE